jgi:copper(I)-binding protein
MFPAKFVIIAAALLLSVGGAAAGDVKVGTLQISTPWARATPKSASTGGGYLTITNTGSTADRLTGGSTAISRGVEIHEMSMEGNVMKMRQLSSGLEIEPGQTVTFKPGGLHLMFVGLKQQLKQGQHFKASLQFEKAGKVEVEFDIAGIGATSPGGDHGHGGMNMKMH